MLRAVLRERWIRRHSIGSSLITHLISHFLSSRPQRSLR